MAARCAQCGASVDGPDRSGACPRCGKPWVAVLPAEAVAASPARTSKLAIASFIFSFLVCAPILNAGLALGMGIGALSAIRASKGELKGRGLAIAGIVLGCFSIIGAIPVLFWAAFSVSRYVEHGRTEAIRTQVAQLGQQELQYFEARGQFLAVPPLPLLAPATEVTLDPNEATRTLGWKPPRTSRYQFQVEVVGSGPAARARVTADLGVNSPMMKGWPPHEEVLVTPDGEGIVTEVPSPLN